MDALKNRILEGMLDYIEGDDDADYTAKDVAECGNDLSEFLSNLKTENIDHNSALNHVRNLVLKLNALNDRCKGSLIETDQREDICELIFSSLTQAGIPFEDDVTEEWREW